jgi:hypothetical protein
LGATTDWWAGERDVDNSKLIFTFCGSYCMIRSVVPVFRIVSKHIPTYKNEPLSFSVTWVKRTSQNIHRKQQTVATLWMN